MNRNVLEYKRYRTVVEIDFETSKFHGKIEGIKDFVNFVADSIDDVVSEFHKAVDDYLALCDELGVEPEKEYRGKFNVRVKPQIHRDLAMKAVEENKSLNLVVEEAISAYLYGSIGNKVSAAHR